MSVFALVVKVEGPGNSITSNFIALNLYLRGVLDYFGNYLKMSIVFFPLWSERSMCL